ncbi:MAG TPA: class I SAM-dependent methyltransferase [Bryobacteraceae bacterium]|jgi:SAM-dependent methyltransferase
MAAAAVATGADYGLENRLTVRHMFSRGAWTIAFGLAMFLINRNDYPGPAAHILIALGLIGAAFIAAGMMMVQASRVERFSARDRILDALALTGEERVLDVGCGTGLMLIGVAKKLKAGRVTGLDLTGEGEAAKENAKLEGVAEKVRIDSLETPKFVYPDNHYDVVVSMLALRHAGESDVREQLVQEMFRVLKPGGRLAIYDVLYTGDFAETLRSAGAQSVELSPVTWPWCLPTRTVAARK